MLFSFQGTVARRSDLTVCLAMLQVVLALLWLSVGACLADSNYLSISALTCQYGNFNKDFGCFLCKLHKSDLYILWRVQVYGICKVVCIVG